MIRILSIRKNTDSRVNSLESEYTQRLKSFSQVQLEDIRMTYPGKPDTTKVLEKEADLFAKRIKPHDCVVVLHDSGKQFTSEAFASWIRDKRDLSKDLTFIIGSAFGLHPSIRKIANLTLSLSKMTFPHELARLLLLETLYRSAEILRGSSYHK